MESYTLFSPRPCYVFLVYYMVHMQWNMPYFNACRLDYDTITYLLWNLAVYHLDCYNSSSQSQPTDVLALLSKEVLSLIVRETTTMSQCCIQQFNMGD